MDLFVTKLTPTATIPSRGSAHAVGYDLSADLEQPMVMPPGTVLRVTTGIAAAIPVGYYGRVAPRSGLALKNGIDVLAGVVDPDYRGDISVILVNHGQEDFTVSPGMRIAQLIIEKVATPDVVVVDNLPGTERGANGFGSTGV